MEYYSDKNSKYYYSYDSGEVFDNEPVVLKLVKDGGRWVFDDFSVYLALYELK